MLDAPTLSKQAVPAEFPLSLNKRPEGSFTLPSSFFANNSINELEMNRIFKRSWLSVGHRSLLKKPGDYVTFRIADQNVFALKGGDGEIRSFHNVCRYLVHELLPNRSVTLAHSMVCPYHARTCEIDGKLQGAEGLFRRPGFNEVDKQEINNSAIRPVGLETAILEEHANPSSGELDHARMDDTADVHVPEEIRLCQSVQSGLRSAGLSRGPLMAGPEPTDLGEPAVHHFHRLVRDARAN